MPCVGLAQAFSPTCNVPVHGSVRRHGAAVSLNLLRAWSCLFIGESAFRYECRVNRHLNDEFNAVRPLTPNDEWYRASSEQIFASAVRGALSDQRSGASRARQLTEEGFDDS